jgi:uncharacterized membrane protein YjjP (DUF1212 family)
MTTLKSSPVPASEDPRSQSEAALHLLQLAARLLLEYNLRSEHIRREIDRLAKHLGESVLTFVAYRHVTFVTENGRDVHAFAPELRINVAINLRTLRVIDDLCAGRIALDEATQRLEAAERTAPRHGRWAVAALIGLAASALAWILHADWGALAASGVSSALGLIARQEMAKRHALLFAQPFVAALIGAGIGGIVIRLGWTGTPELCLVVPALMLVPGPHLINGVDDVLENHMQTGIGRLSLAVAVLLAAALGVSVGAWFTLGAASVRAAAPDATQLTLPVDVALAGLAACGFGAFYNAPWRVVSISVVCGMLGHGVRFLVMGQGLGPEIATLAGCLAIGLATKLAVDRLRLPFAAVAFAGAVPMMPGVFIYESIAGATRMAAAGTAADPALAAATLALAFKSVLVVGAMAVGLLAGARISASVSRRLRRT